MLVYGTEKELEPFGKAIKAYEEIARAYGEKIIYENKFYKKKYVKNKQRRTIRMTKEEISKAIAECEERLRILREELNKPEYDDKRPKMKMGEGFFYVGNSGNIFEGIWTGNDICKNIYATGNVFHTQEAAEFELERRRVITELSSFAEGGDTVWDVFHEHWTMYYNHSDKSVGIVFHKMIKYPGLYFSTEKIAKAAIKTVGEERIKKYYFGAKQ